MSWTAKRRWSAQIPSIQPTWLPPNPQRHVVRLPGSLVIDNTRCVVHWRSNFALVVQNYSRDGRESVFKAYAIEQVHHAEGAIEETLGHLLGQFGNLSAATECAGKQQSLS